MNNKKQAQLNFARKWRSQTFDTIIGQHLCLKMLKNSLYRDHYFPVYLFSGQKGCGKTTTARIFAAAVNCEKLAEFQKSPKLSSIPCLTCTSCSAFYAGKHPDFIEIDAASHTGVDNVRYIIDAAALLPLMGQKKIYLIDEAHMLSKAAFNAFLKILEEPPLSVLFILATTDAEKILETVRSRCFQLFFKPIEMRTLVDHLAYICEQENIYFDQDGLKTIAIHTGGSARDALNILEQVRFASNRVTKQAAQAVLEYIDEEVVVKIFSLMLHSTITELLIYLKELALHTYNVEYIWRTIISIARTSLWLKHGVQPEGYVEYHQVLKKVVEHVSWEHINEVLDQLYHNEHIFLKTADQYGVLEIVLIQICQKNKKNNNGNSGPASAVHNAIGGSLSFSAGQESHEQDIDEEELKSFGQPINDNNCKNQWDAFIKKLENKNDPLAYSLFKQATFSNFEINKKIVSITFGAKFAFFNDLLEQTKNVWQPLLEASFGASVILNAIFEGQSSEIVTKQPEVLEKSILKKESNNSLPEIKINQKPQARYRQLGSVQKIYIGKALTVKKDIDVSDKTCWPKIHLLQHYFPGIVKEISAS